MIRTAIITAAGKGTRLLPATRIIPKVMLPLLNTPALELVVREALAAGIERIIIIIGQDGEIIQKYFNEPGQPWDGKIQYVHQPIPKGLGHAIRCAGDIVQSEPFLLMFGDSVFLGSNPSQELVQHNSQYHCSVIAVQEVLPEDVYKRGIIAVSSGNDGRLPIINMVEKPNPEEAPSNLSFIARGLFNPEIFKCIDRVTPDKTGEIQLTPAINYLLETQSVDALVIKEERLDIGNPADYAKAVMAYYKQMFS